MKQVIDGFVQFNQAIKKARLTDGTFTLQGYTITGVNLGDITITGGEFVDCTFYGNDLADGGFTRTAFTECRFEFLGATDAEMRENDFKDCYFRGLDALRADFTGSQFEGCTLQTTVFINTNLENTMFFDCELYGATMTLANLKKAGFIKCNFRNSNATYANFTMTNLTDSNLSGLSWCGSVLSNTPLGTVYLMPTGRGLVVDALGKHLTLDEFAELTFKDEPAKTSAVEAIHQLTAAHHLSYADDLETTVSKWKEQ